MSGKESLFETIGRYISAFVGKERYYSDTAIVKSVQDDYTCTVQVTDGALLEGVRLQQTEGEEGFFVVPAVNSTVIISYTDSTTAYISMFSEIENIVFNGGDNGGLINITDLTAKLNGLVNEVRALKTALDGHTHIDVTAGAGISGIPSPFTANFSDFDKSDYEDDKFTH